VSRLVVFAVFVLFLSYGFSQWGHENAHVEINSKQGIDSYIVLDFGGLRTVADVYPLRDDVTRLGHSFNEAVGYQLTPLLLGVMGLQVIGIIQKEMMEND